MGDRTLAELGFYAAPVRPRPAQGAWRHAPLPGARCSRAGLCQPLWQPQSGVIAVCVPCRAPRTQIVSSMLLGPMRCAACSLQVCLLLSIVNIAWFPD